MARFFVPPEQLRNGRFSLRGAEARHARMVLRKKPGDEIELFDGKDLSFVGRIDQVEEDLVAGILLEATRGRENPVGLTLCQALLKGPKWDWLVEKAAEIGVRRLEPLVTARTVVQADEQTSAGKRERWSRIALAASKQSGRSSVMEIAAPVAFTEALENLAPAGIHLIPWEKEDARSISQAFAGRTEGPVQLFIGPEGGWDSDEVNRAERKGVLPVRLGPTLLRSETAGIAASVLVLRELKVY